MSVLYSIVVASFLGLSCLLVESLTEVKYQLVRFLTNPLAKSSYYQLTLVYTRVYCS